MRKFNVTGVCVPAKDYMVDINNKLEQIMRLVNDGCYFTINRARQFGKTTTLSRLQKTMPNEYVCARISFQGVGDESFETAGAFCKMFIGLIHTSLQFASVEEGYRESWVDCSVKDFTMLNRHISKMCRGKKVILMIDEVDKTSHNRVFLHFIDMLREKFLLQREDMDDTFHSVILTGVYDIKNIKLKLMNEGVYTPTVSEGKIYNSPWNIAVNFKVDMSFNPVEIASMLTEYEKDHKMGIDISAASNEIYNYTSGYPFLVSRICQCIDEELYRNWTAEGVQEAVKVLLAESNTLFGDLFKNLENSADLYNLIYDILIVGEKKIFNIDNPTIHLGSVYGIINESERYVAISNKIFEIRICDILFRKTR